MSLEQNSYSSPERPKYPETVHTTLLGIDTEQVSDEDKVFILMLAEGTNIYIPPSSYLSIINHLAVDDQFDITIPENEVDGVKVPNPERRRVVVTRDGEKVITSFGVAVDDLKNPLIQSNSEKN